MPGKKEKVKIAVIGCGRIAWLGFLPWIKEHPHAELAGVADMDENQARRTARAFGARAWHTDWRALLEKNGVHAAIITTPPWAHTEPAIFAAERGLHVLCEKPMAATVEDARAMIRACEKNNVLLQIGFSLRFDPGYEKLKMMVQTGEIGRVFQLKSEFDAYVPDLTKFPMREIVEIGGRLKLFGSRDMGAWRVTDPRAGGGVFSDHGIHYADLFRWILEEEVVAVTGATQKTKPSVAFEDHASCFLRFESGAAAFLEASLCRWSARDEIDQGLLHGERGCLKYKMDQSWYLLGFPRLNNVHARLWKYGNVSFALGRWMPVHTPYGKEHVMFKRQLDYFIAKIRGEYKPHPVFGEAWGATGHDGLRALEIARAVYASNETNQSISLA